MWMYIWFGLAMLEAAAILWLVVVLLRSSERHNTLGYRHDNLRRLHVLRVEERKARAALRDIAAQETPKANATVKRMARIAREGLS